MFLYRTLDGRRWLYGGTRPVGLPAGLADKLERIIPDAGPLDWAEHSQLWAGAVAGADLDRLAQALVVALLDHFGTAPTAEQIAERVRALLTHPG